MKLKKELAKTEKQKVKKKELIFPVESMVKLSNELVHIGFLMSDKIPKDKQGFSTSSENMPIKNKK